MPLASTVSACQQAVTELFPGGAELLQSVTEPRLLVVDDDPGIRELLSEYLAGQGFEVAAVGDSAAMDDWLTENQVDLIILDLMLPGEDGLSILRRLRTGNPVAVIMLTARHEDIDRIIGLEMGADDYLPKPFNPRELVARIRAVLRRMEPSIASLGAALDQPETTAAIRFGEFRLIPEQMELFRDQQRVALTSGEMDLLLLLAGHPDRVLSRDWLLDQLSGRDRDPFDRSIDVRINRLRSKLEDDPQHPRFIKTVWGKGYRFTPSAESETGV